MTVMREIICCLYATCFGFHPLSLLRGPPMKWLCSATCLAALLSLASLPPATGGQKKAYETFGKIVRLDPRLDKLLAKDAPLEKLAGGFVWTEGTVWVKDGGFLLF